ncbi:MAG: aldehyde dehydrogenase family protein [Syntrophorhabdaceae bacterium]|nr:aldehyde dehydrogenase family protein [Syntrophorhabdaceae bacterium]MDD4195728.1 aldehyde dehydrogenase family protein [Syntrophorhabdaceae bacterium]
MEKILTDLGLDASAEHSGAGCGSWLACKGTMLESVSPIDGHKIGRVKCADRDDYETVITRAIEAFEEWRTIPAPRRGDVVRQIGNALRARKKDLGDLVSLEMGKIRAEGEGEVQEMIDMADLAVGQSRMLYGKTMPSERPWHRLYEQWHPLGPVGVITSFNFPLAVWAWNAMIALVAGDTVVWKPSSKTPMCAVAAMQIIWEVLNKNSLPEGILNLVIGPHEIIGSALVMDRRVPLISATGSVRMGSAVGAAVKARLGRTILELGGNNGIIVTPSADLDLAVKAILFGAVGTAGQRCTSTRRLIVHKSIYKNLADRLTEAYRQVHVGDPLEETTLMGPLIDREAVDSMQLALERLVREGGEVLFGGEVLSGGLFDTGTYVSPSLCRARVDMPVVQEETFAPILYLIEYETLEEAIRYHNLVPQGLSSAIFTSDLREAELFLSQCGSDCGIANVNAGTSGAEIGGAFGGEKETGGGREAGSDVWKAYMRRQTCTINWSGELPLAQGIQFDMD